MSKIRELLSDKENWQEITSKEQYQFLGVSTEATLNKLLFCEDISKLPQYVAANPHFLGMIFQAMCLEASLKIPTNILCTFVWNKINKQTHTLQSFLWK